MTGRQRFSDALNSWHNRKVDKPLYISGLLGIFTNGKEQIEVTGRNAYVWVRLRNSTNEIIQALNEVVSPIYSLPVLVERDPHTPNRYRIVGRDVGRYGDWGSASPFLPDHGNQHSFGGSGGGDTVWVYGRQFMPLLVYPTGTGGNSLCISDYTYFYNNTWHYAGNSTTPNLTVAKPSDNQARMLLICMDSDSGSAYYLTGTSFDATITGSSSIISYLPRMIDANDIPVAGVRLVSGTTTIGWNNLYDLRPYYTTWDLGFSGTANTLLIYDDLVFKATGTAIDFGSNLSVVVSGTVAYVSVMIPATSTGTTTLDNIMWIPPSGLSEAFPKTDSGLNAATVKALAAPHGVIEIPNCTLTGTHTFAAGTKYLNKGARFTNQITLSSGTKAFDMFIDRDANSTATLIGFTGPTQGTAYLYKAQVEIGQAGVGTGIGVDVSAGGDVWAQDCRIDVIASGSAHAGKYTNGFLYVVGGSWRGSTDRFTG